MLSHSSSSDERSTVIRFARHLPPELLDLIASFVDSHRDLLAFACACRAFKRLLIPWHLDYRLVRCHIDRQCAWSHLVERPDLARNVRGVQVYDFRSSMQPLPDRVPPAVSRTVVDGEAVKTAMSTPDKLLGITHALRSMDNLQDFRWSTGWSYVCPNEIEKQLFAEFELWAAVSQKSTLRRLEVLDLWNGWRPPTGFASEFTYDSDTYPLWSISNLSVVRLSNVRFLQQQGCILRFCEVLRRSPTLESLSLNVIDRSFDLLILLRHCQFSNLRQLCVEVGSRSASAMEAFARLLEHTPTLEDVRWKFASTVRPLEARSLPALKRLSAWEYFDSGHDTFGFDLLVDEDLPPRALETIAGIRLTPSSLAMLGRVDSSALRRLELSGFDTIGLVVEVANMFPRLTWLAIPSIDYMHDYGGVTNEPVHRAQFADVLEALPELEVFHGISLFKDPDLEAGTDYNDERALELATFCPTLRRVDHWDMNPNTVVILESGGEHVTWRVEKIPDYWGGYIP
ncbi:hypothetical protein BV25DRAFT_1821207 [Artomyces pyxidatus]|uniref:Uncharacterized protein n=1 Tax=Artomyces pyxidatus TaxID=48021 RepID=A0ACB8TCD7_9AGAM|nr:hypothetical protein BV25DRAFT_1821207 [Artomyces pyxidatus]